VDTQLLDQASHSGKERSAAQKVNGFPSKRFADLYHQTLTPSSFLCSGTEESYLEHPLDFKFKARSSQPRCFEFGDCDKK